MANEEKESLCPQSWNTQFKCCLRLQHFIHKSLCDTQTSHLLLLIRPAEIILQLAQKWLQRLQSTWCGLLQRVPAIKGPLLLLAQVGAVLQQPMRDPALADAWKAARHRVTTERFAPSTGAICRQPRRGGLQETGERVRGWGGGVEPTQEAQTERALPSLTELLSP